MTLQELLEIEGNPPILLADGAFGLVIQSDDEQDKIGVQVPGEDAYRWIDVAQVVDTGNGALMQRIEARS
jgi:hypothetical protein